MNDTTQSPGQVFAAAYAAQGVKATAEFSSTITELFPGFKRRPRIAMRSLFKVVKTERKEASYWFETRPKSEAVLQVEDARLRPEAAFEFHVDQAPLKPTRAWVQVEPSLLEDLEAFATFIDFRLLVRLGTAENQGLTLGSGGDRMRGLLETPGIERIAPGPDPIASLLMACDRVEQMGGSADGVVLNTTDYYRHFVGRGSLLTDLANLGIKIARTRMLSPGTAIIGDFTAGATIFDSGHSTIRFGVPPRGTFARDGLAVCGEICETLVIHLPTHFFIAALV